MTDRSQRYIVGMIWALIALALFLAAWTPRWIRYPVLPPASGAVVRDFAMLDPTGRTPAATFRQAVFSLSALPPEWWGTFAPGDSFTGTLTSTRFGLQGRILQVPIIGYPNSPGNRLALQILRDDGQVENELVFSGQNPREAPGVWEVEIGKWSGREARLQVRDGLTSLAGWLGVATPRYGVFRGITWLYQTPRNYLWLSLVSLSVVGLIFIPGFIYNLNISERFCIPFALIPVPALLIGGAAGLTLWHLGPRPAPHWPAAWLVTHGIAALALAVVSMRKPTVSRRDGPVAAIYIASVIGALAFGVAPVGVAQEFSAHSTAQARMIASPPDHIIPYYTAAYFFWGLDGKERSTEYFGNSWTVGSRGPLAPLLITVGYYLFGDHATNPPGGRTDYWPASGDGFYIARVVGIATNALVILGGWLLAGALAGDTAFLAVAWLGVSPLLLLNLDFLWPKLLATYFLLGCIRYARRPHRTAVAACFAALAYYSHPVGALLLPVVIIYYIWGTEPARWSGKLLKATGFSVVLLALLSPWLAFKYWLHARDLFLRYPLGDGQGFNGAVSGLSWLRTRWNNFWFTIVPFAFYCSAKMHAWLAGPLSSPDRWAIGYAKSLPGAIGMVSYLISLGLAWRQKAGELRRFGIIYIFGSLLLMLLFWGYSDDGLGRNCLEPLAAIYIIYISTSSLLSRPLATIILLSCAAEAISLRVIDVFPELISSHLYRSTEAGAAILVSCLPFFLVPYIYFLTFRKGGTVLG